jgi:hypothetical protein
MNGRTVLQGIYEEGSRSSMHLDPHRDADSREDIVRLYNEYRAGQFERVSVGSNGRNLT